MSSSPDSRISTDTRGVEIEYAALRNEILKRIEMRQQIISITLTLAGVFLGVGLNNQPVALIYPPLAMFLAFNWAHNDFRIRITAKYIRENLETAMPSLRYETRTSEQRKQGEDLGTWRFLVLAHSGVFLLTQLMAVGVGIAKFGSNLLEWFLLGLDIIAVLVVVWLMARSVSSGRNKERRS